WDSTLYNYGYNVISYVNGKTKVDKNKLREFVDKVILGEGYETPESLRKKFNEYNKSKSGSKTDKMIYNIKYNKNKIPNIIISNKWKYLMGKIGSAGATFVTLKKTNNEDDWFSNPLNGYEVHGVKMSDKKSINDLPSFEAIVFGPFDSFEDGDKYKIMYTNEIHKYLSREENQEFYVYKID
ncbi:hypothetical protein M0Q97_07260, partial [Candidatus Dojkabacteria bacterium]|nr:hypothetical protein [Candidatus Dojkabacteria bacterium]